jgi:hypothetical protein
MSKSMSKYGDGNLFKRNIMFLFGCIVSRLLLVYIVKNIDTKYLPYIAVLTFIIAMSWIIIFVFDLRKTGIEVNNEKIWWNNLRPIHAILYLLFSYSAYNRLETSYIYLLLDVILGLSAFIFNRLTLTF